MRGWRLGPGEVRRRRATLRGPEESPDDPARFHRWEGPRADLVREAQLLRLIQHVHAAPVDVELPAVVDAAQSAVFVPPQEERGLPVRAALVEQPDAPPRVAKSHQLLAQQFHARGRAIGLGQLPRQERGDPVPPHCLAHGGTPADAGDSLVLVACQHAQALLAFPDAITRLPTGRESTQRNSPSSGPDAPDPALTCPLAEANVASPSGR